MSLAAPAAPAALRTPAPTADRWLSRGAALLAATAGLAAVLQVHAAGETLLATTLLLILGLALWTYTSARTHALRYLFPGVAAALVFVVFPMLYTVGLGFTNYSSRNLMEQDAVRQHLLAEAVPVAGTRHAFSLHGTEGAWRLQLQAPDGRRLATAPLALPADGQPGAAPHPDAAAGAPLALTPASADLGPEQPMPVRVARLDALRALRLQTPEGQTLTLATLREFGAQSALYRAESDGALVDTLSGTRYRPDRAQGFYTAEDGRTLTPGYRVGVGLQHYATVFSEGKFREPFLGVLLWTVAFAALSVIGAAGLGLLLAVLLNWEALPFKGAYRLVLFLPYAVPGFISILVFKGLFNQNLGEINLILHSLFGIRPAWFSDPLLARAMLLIVNVWLGFPYMMVLCTGLIKSIPGDLYEASAILGAGPWTNFRRITLPLILKPLTPLLISAFAFNINNFVLISLLTGGRPDHLDTSLPAGTTDILVSYTWRIAFQDSGQQFGLAAAISTVIFLIVAVVTLVQMRFSRIADQDAR